MGTATVISSLAVLVVACSAPQAKMVHLSLAAKRVEALDSAYDKAYPGLASCEGSVYATLSESYLLMQKGLVGIRPGHVMSNGYVIVNSDPVTRRVHSYFYTS